MLRDRQSTWLRITVIVSPQAEEAAGEILRTAGCVGWQSAGPGTLVGYLPANERSHVRLETVREQVAALQRCGLDPGPAEVTAECIEEQPWAQVWRSYFRPLRVGRVLVCPTWERMVLGADEVGVRLDPGMAFGSGAHATTRLCLWALQETLAARPGARVLDVGTGSGILAIAAARLGAVWVLALDTDPDVIPIAAKNVALNGVGDKVEVREGNVSAAGAETFDVVVANIAPDPIMEMALQIRTLLRPGGVFIGGGIPVERTKEVGATLEAKGFQVMHTLEEEGWSAVLAQ